MGRQPDEFRQPVPGTPNERIIICCTCLLRCIFLGATIAGLLVAPTPLFAGNWVYFDACGVVMKGGIIPDPNEAEYVYGPAPQIKGYLVNTSAVMLMAEMRRYAGLRCTVLVGPGGNAVHVIGDLEEVRRKLEDE